MMKSPDEIEQFVYQSIKGSNLEKNVTGKLSCKGRPNKSDKEDIVISAFANGGCGQSQRSYVNVNVYVRDKWNASTKAWEKDTIRIRELCEFCKFLFTIRKGDFHTRPKDCSFDVKRIEVKFEDGHTEHFINNRLYIEINNE